MVAGKHEIFVVDGVQICLNSNFAAIQTVAQGLHLLGGDVQRGVFDFYAGEGGDENISPGRRDPESSAALPA